MVDSISALKDATQRFDQSVSRTISAAQGLSEPNTSAPDLPSAIVDLSVAEKSVKAVMATVRVSKEMDAGVLDIVA
jgi:hypothetical protein